VNDHSETIPRPFRDAPRPPETIPRCSEMPRYLSNPFRDASRCPEIFKLYRRRRRFAVAKTTPRRSENHSNGLLRPCCGPAETLLWPC
jgi:hypothetical protein